MGLSAAMLAGLLALPTGSLADTADDEAAIQEIWSSYAAAVVAGDADTWLSLWDPAGKRYPPGAHGVGYDIFSKAIPKNFAGSTVTSMTITQEEFEIMGDWAYSLGVFDRDWVADGEELHMDGKFMTILKRADDGSWLIYRDIFNSSPPE
jgi:ketosteroid isomerase-like protein